MAYLDHNEVSTPPAAENSELSSRIRFLSSSSLSIAKNISQFENFFLPKVLPAREGKFWSSVFIANAFLILLRPEFVWGAVACCWL